jgi:hypothetical protein
MWTAVNLTTTTLWDDLLWHVSATWRDDGESDPVVLHRSGRSERGAADDPIALLAVALGSLERDVEGLSAASAAQAGEL